jgi:hypothetical protein
LESGCVEGEPASLSIQALPEHAGEARINVIRLGSAQTVFETKATLAGDGQPVKVALPALAVGGYSAQVRIVPKGQADGEDGAQPATRRDFACEKGGDEWADSRPDAQRLINIAKSTGGVSVSPDDLDKLPMPATTFVASRRNEAPLAPPWVWSTVAAVMVGLHWVLRRRAGFA